VQKGSTSKVIKEFNIQGKQTSFYKYCPGTFGYTLWGFGVTNNHSLLSSCVQIVWFNSAVCEQVDGTVLTACNIWASHSLSKCANCRGWVSLQTQCRLLIGLQIPNLSALNLTKYCSAMSITRQQKYKFRFSVFFYCIGNGKTWYKLKLILFVKGRQIIYTRKLPLQKYIKINNP
jgi:hypothetical protein